jgi:hypothetical protein
VHARDARQCLLELGQPAWQFLCQLVHRCPEGRWEKPCSELYELLTKHGDGFEERQQMTARAARSQQRRTQDLLDLHRVNTRYEVSAVDAVPVPMQEPRRGIVWKSIDDLLTRPASSGLVRDVEVHDASSCVLEHDEHVQQLERGRGHHEEVDGSGAMHVPDDIDPAHACYRPEGASEVNQCRNLGLGSAGHDPRGSRGSSFASARRLSNVEVVTCWSAWVVGREGSVRQVCDGGLEGRGMLRETA